MKKLYAVTAVILILVATRIALAGVINSLPYIVTVEDLIQHPETFDGKVISMAGYCSVGFERTALFDTQEHYKFNRAEYGIWLDFNGGAHIYDTNGIQLPDNYNCEGQPVIVEGVYSASEKGHFSAYTGSLKKIKIKLFENENLLRASAKESLVLYVSNQSVNLNPVDITVFVDSLQVINDLFDVKGKRVIQYNRIKYKFKIPEGEHLIYVNSQKGTAELTRKIIFDSVWFVNIEYHFSNEYSGELNNKKFFHFLESKKEFRFQ